MNQDVTSVAKAPEPYSEAPAAIDVVTQDEIQRSGASSIPEALQLADNLEVAVTLVHVAGDPVTNLELLGGLRSRAVDLHVAAPAGGGGLGASGADADRPQPGVDPGGGFVIRCGASHDR